MMPLMKMVGIVYGVKRKKMSRNFDYEGYIAYLKIRTDWTMLNTEQKRLARINNSKIYQRYLLSEIWGEEVIEHLPETKRYTTIFDSTGGE